MTSSQILCVAACCHCAFPDIFFCRLQKVDLGPCPKSHSPRLQEEYKAAVASGKRYYAIEAEYRKNISMFMADVDRKISMNRRRLDVTPEESQKLAALTLEVKELEQAHVASMAEVERLGEAGQVEESLSELTKANALQEELNERQAELQKMAASAGSSGHQKLQVCDVCGAYLSILDSDRRLADHFQGKMHLGYLKLRELITEFKADPLEPPPRAAAPPSAPDRGTRPYDRHSRPESFGGYGPRDPRDARDSRNSREARESRDSRDARDPRDARDARAPRDVRDPRDRAERWDRGYPARPHQSRPLPAYEQPLHYGGGDGYEREYSREYSRDRRDPRERSDPRADPRAYRKRSRSPGYEPARRRPVHYD